MELNPDELAFHAATRLLQVKQPTEAFLILEQALAVPATAASPYRLALELLAGETAHQLGRWQHAEEHFRRAARMTQDGPELAWERARVQILRSRTSGRHPAYRRGALRDLQAALLPIRKQNDLPALLEGLEPLCQLLLLEEQWESALRYSQQLGEAARMLHRRSYLAMAKLLEGTARRGLGDYRQAAQCLNEAAGQLEGLAPDELDAELTTPSFGLQALKAQTWLTLARVRGDQGRRSEVVTLVQQVIELEEEGFDLETNLPLRLLSILYPAQPQAAGSNVGQALRELVLLAETRLPEEAEVWLEAALALARRAANPADGLALVEKLTRAVATLTRPDLHCRCIRLQVALLLRQGDMTRALDCLRRELQRVAREPHHWIAALLKTDLAQTLLSVGGLAEALTLAEQAIPILLQAGLDLALLQAHHVAAEAYRSARLTREAEDHLKQAELLLPVLGDDLAAAVLLLERAMLSHDLGERGQARQAFQKLLEQADKLGEQGLLANAQIHLANLLIDEGNRVAARGLLDRARAIPILVHLPRAQVQLLIAQARLFQQLPVLRAEMVHRLHEAFELATARGLRVEEEQIARLLEQTVAERV